MGSLMLLGRKTGLPPALEETLPFLDEIDGNALSEAVLGPKPKLNPLPHGVWHKGELYLSMNGKITKDDPWKRSCNEW